MKLKASQNFMRIVADENIPFVRQAFAEFGEVHTLPGRAIAPVDLKDAEVLLVRSVTQVNAELLAQSAVRFVGTATIGEDHIDTAWLDKQKIAFTSAPGSNAESAAEYVVSALLTMAERRGEILSNQRVGIIGCGNVGTRVRAKLRALGMQCLIYDPPRAERGVVDDYASLAQILACDVVSLHVPLVKSGPYPTLNLADEAFFAALSPNAIFINTARGAVVEESALLAKLTTCPNFSAVIDVWRNEPNINLEILRRAALATPHIAGYSRDGKVNGTETLYRALCRFMLHNPTWSAQAVLEAPTIYALRLSAGVSAQEAVTKTVRACYDIRSDDAALRRIFYNPDQAGYFDRLRKNYPPRREFSHLTVHTPDGSLANTLQSLGFHVDNLA